LSEDGQTTLLSKSSVSQVTEVLWEQYEAFTKRDLSGFDVVYLFADAVYESLKQQACCTQAVLVSWRILRDGSKVLLHMSLGNKESNDAWLEHFRSLVSRGLPTPLTMTSDGAPGLVKAIEAMWPEAERIRCRFHKMANVLDKVPDDQRETIKRLLFDVRDAPDDPHHQPGGTGVRGRASPLEGDPEVPHGEGVSQARLRHAVAGEPTLAEGEVHRDREATTRGVHPRAPGHGKERA
jgi:transposase-like protein